MIFKHHIKRLRHNPLTTISYYFTRKIVSPVIRLVWVKKVIGIENIPKYGPAIIAFNHQSYFDFICFIAISPRNIHFIAAEKFFKNAYWRILMTITGQIKVERLNKDKHETHVQVHDHIDAGKIIGIFPEGTRSPDEHVMLKAFSGVARYAVSKKVPIIPVGIKGTFNVMSKHDKKPRVLKIVEFNIGKPILIKDNNFEVNYEVITHKVMQEISLLSGKQYPHTHS